MRRVLHILTKPDDALAQTLVSLQENTAAHQVEVVDLTQPKPDYEALLEKIFAADSVESW